MISQSINLVKQTSDYIYRTPRVDRDNHAQTSIARAESRADTESSLPKVDREYRRASSARNDPIG